MPQDFTLIETLPHDPTSFTEGLYMQSWVLWESSGSPRELPQTQSIFGTVDMKSGAIDTKAKLDKNIYFGEWITELQDKIYWLTYKNKKGFIYDASTFVQLESFDLTTDEGWWLTNDGKSLIMSDGTNMLTFIDPKTLKPSKTLSVTEWWVSVKNINELEYVDGYIYANIWLTDDIVQIDIDSEKVIKRYSLGDITRQEKETNPNAMEMNGIAHDARNDTFLITGKLWEHIYRMKLAK